MKKSRTFEGLRVVGPIVGFEVGNTDGFEVGNTDGFEVIGVPEGLTEGIAEGNEEGVTEGVVVGAEVGSGVSDDHIQLNSIRYHFASRCPLLVASTITNLRVFVTERK